MKWWGWIGASVLILIALASIAAWLWGFWDEEQRPLSIMFLVMALATALWLSAWQ